MADSNITKNALANALKELMEEYPFEKINVAQICEKCNMNRKSFYYHFKDKYDLVNWIFDVEFISILTTTEYNKASQNFEERWNLFNQICRTFYENKTFYRKALKVRGQNSFSEHFQECIYPILYKRIEELTTPSPANEFVTQFLTDACICTLTHWLSQKECISPEEFSGLLKSIIYNSAISISNQIEKGKDI